MLGVNFSGDGLRPLCHERPLPSLKVKSKGPRHLVEHNSVSKAQARELRIEKDSLHC